MQQRVRVALIGCGRIARVHRSYLRDIPAVELIGAWDADAAACQTFASETGIAPAATLEELIDRRPDVAHVLTPPQSHAATAVRLLDAGINALVEKPFAMTAAEADRILAAARRARRWVTADHNRYFDPVVQDAQRRARMGQLGRIVGVEVYQGAELGEQQLNRAHWNAQLPGGALHNLASHPLYLMRRFAGPVRNLRVLGHVGTGEAGAADAGAADALEEVRLVAEGDTALAYVSMSVHTRPFTNRLCVYGTEASLDINLNNMTLIERRPRQLPKLVGKVWPNLSEAGQLLAATLRNGVAYATGRQRFYPGIGLHLQALYRAVVAGEPPPVSDAEARDVVAWYDEILSQCGIRPATYPRAVEA